MKIIFISFLCLLLASCATVDFITSVRKRVNSYLRKHPQASSDIKSAMLELKIKQGMDTEQVRAIVGEPDDIKYDTINEKPHQEWVYNGAYVVPKSRGRAKRDVYYHFEDGIFIGWDNDIIRYVRNHPELSDEIRSAILKDKIILGMNSEQVRLIYGEPDSINKAIGDWGVREQWKFGKAFPAYFYFENDLLKRWGQ